MASDATSSRTTLDTVGLLSVAVLDPALSQSTKDRRRERNRLAAQKHRLRRNERMNQLEQQVLALQQEKSILLARIGDSTIHAPTDAPKAPPTPSTSPGSSAHSEDADDDIDMDDDDADDNESSAPPAVASPLAVKRQRLSIDPLLPARPSPSPSPAPSSSYHHHQPPPPPLRLVSPLPSLPPPSALSLPPPPPPSLPPIDAALALAALPSSSPHAAYTARLEDRIVELERWTEDLNGELADARDSHSRSADDLHRRLRRAHEQLAHAEHQRAHALREADALRHALDARAEDDRHAQTVAQQLRAELEATERDLDLQRAENDRLRDRLARQDVEHVRARSVESAVSSRKRKHDEDPAEDAMLSCRLSQTETLLASRSQQLQHAQSEAEERGVDCRRLSGQVYHLQHALGRAGAYLTSKGVPLDFLEESDDE